MKNDILICSNALLILGDNPIAYWTESDGGKAAEKLYPQTKRGLLMSHPYTWAYETASLNRLTAPPEAYLGYSYAYQYPPDCLELWEVFPYTLKFAIHGQMIYANHDSLAAGYIKDVSENDFSDKFQEGIEQIMAGKLAMTVTGDKELALFWTKEGKQMIAEAKNLDSKQRPNTPIRHKPFSEVRR